jgi:hypothetical protein
MDDRSPAPFEQAWRVAALKTLGVFQQIRVSKEDETIFDLVTSR